MEWEVEEGGVEGMCWISNNIWRAVPFTSCSTVHPAPHGGHSVRDAHTRRRHIHGCVCLLLTVWICVYMGVSLMVWSVCLAHKPRLVNPHMSASLWVTPVSPSTSPCCEPGDGHSGMKRWSVLGPSLTVP